MAFELSLQAVLTLFVNAYGSEFLSSARLRRLDVVNNYEDELSVLLTHVTALDLTGCLLGDFHDLVYHIGRGLKSLEFLNLSHNNLTNRGLR